MPPIRVAEIWRYPVKSMRGQRLERAEALADGIAGDRLARLEDERGLLTARRKQLLVGVEAGVGEDGEPLVEGLGWRSERAAERVREIAGEGAQLVATASGKRFDAHPILVCTDSALAALGEDCRRFRPNIVLEGVGGLAEREWIGLRLSAGSAILAVCEPCERCAVTTIDPDTIEVRPDVLRRVNDELDGIMGVYCEVEKPGTIAEGDVVELNH